MGIQVDISNTLDSPDVKVIKTALREYSEIITDCAIFNTNNNKDDLTNTIYKFLEDLYVTEPEEVINFINQKPSKKLIINIFRQFGISEKHISRFPDILKTKTAYLLNQLFETKGSIYTFELFNEVVKEFYHNLNFYNVQIEQRQFLSKYNNPGITKIFYLNADGSIHDMYPVPQGQSEIQEDVFRDESIGYKIFTKLDASQNEVLYHIKFFEVLENKVKLKINFGADDIIVPKDVDEWYVTLKKYDIYGRTALTQGEKEFYLDPANTEVKHKYFVDSNGEPIASYGKTTFEMLHYSDPAIDPTIISNIDNVDDQDIISFELVFAVVTTQDIKFRLFDFESIIIPSGSTRHTIEVQNYKQSVRDEQEIVYKLEPVLINDPLNVITNINPSDLRTSKYLMQRYDYFSTDTRNELPANVFPIITNVMFIQFGSAEAVDAMEILPDLVRMFAMTYTQDKLFSFNVGSSTIKIPMNEYINLLTYMKLKEIELKNPGWSYGTFDIPGKQFSSLTFPYDRLEEIYNLITFYKDMKHEHNVFLEFKRRLSAMLQETNQQRETRIYNISQFHTYLAGNIPSTFPEFFAEMEEFYPNVTYDAVGDVATGVLFAGKDQNKIMKEEVQFIYTTYSPATPQELFDLIAIQDKEYVRLNNSVYDMLKQHFISKYPRVIQQIDAITTPSDITRLFLSNYKRVLVDVTKMDNLVTLFVNDTFTRFLLGDTFKEEFFNPVIELFQQYFFKAELSYQNLDQILHIVKDKMQQVTTGSESSFHVSVEKTSELLPIDRYNLLHKQNIIDTQSLDDAWSLQIINNNSIVHTSDDTNDTVYNPNNI